MPASLVYTQLHNFAPRVGFAWRMGRGNRTVVRGGYGIFYAGSAFNAVRNDLGNMFPFSVT